MTIDGGKRSSVKFSVRKGTLVGEKYISLDIGLFWVELAWKGE